MAECMAFPKTADEFIGQYKFTDTKQEYTNGAELIPVFRVKQMMEHYFAKDNNVPSKWIPVTERLPQGADGKSLCEIVLAYLDNGEVIGQVCTGWLNGDKWYLTVGEDDHYTVWALGAVTHWMPLPQPPKGE